MTSPDSPGNDRPLRLRELAEVESPEVVRSALRRFRRRTLVWSLWLVLLLVALLVFLVLPRTLGPREYLPRRFVGAPGAEVGRILQEGSVQVTVLDARRLTPEEVGLHLVIAAKDLESDEELVAQPGISGFIEVIPIGGLGPIPPAPPEMATTGKGNVLEAWIAFAPRIRRVSFDVAALLRTRVSGPGPPPLIPGEVPGAAPVVPSPPSGPRTCAVAVNEFGQCALYEDEGRLLATVRLDMEELGIPPRIWKEVK
jgi:hypothetical protein